MTRVYIIRHAEAEGNLYRRIHGQYNSNLTKLGMKQLDALEERFKNVPIHKVYSSDLKRTMMTSTAITRSRGIEAQPLPEIREVFMGRWEDLEWGNAEFYDREELIKFHLDPASWSIEGSENFYVLQDRMIRSIIEKARENDGKNIAMFSHGAAIRALTAKLAGIRSSDITKIKFCDNTAVMTLDVHADSIDMVSEGDASHITDGYSRFHRQNWHKSGEKGLDSSNLRMERASQKDINEANYWFPNGEWARCAEDDVSVSYKGDVMMGLVAVNTVRYAPLGMGVIDICCLAPKYREQRYLPQLIGRAVSICRRDGMKSLALGTAKDDTLQKFVHLGFEQVTEPADISCKLDITV